MTADATLDVLAEAREAAIQAVNKWACHLHDCPRFDVVEAQYQERDYLRALDRLTLVAGLVEAEARLLRAGCFEALIRDAETCIEMDERIREQDPNGVLGEDVWCGRCVELAEVRRRLAALGAQTDVGAPEGP